MKINRKKYGNNEDKQEKVWSNEDKQEKVWSNEDKQEKVVRQEDPLIPTLFNIYINDLFNELDIDNSDDVTLNEIDKILEFIISDSLLRSIFL